MLYMHRNEINVCYVHMTLPIQSVRTNRSMILLLSTAIDIKRKRSCITTRDIAPRNVGLNENATWKADTYGNNGNRGQVPLFRFFFQNWSDC